MFIICYIFKRLYIYIYIYLIKVVQYQISVQSLKKRHNFKKKFTVWLSVVGIYYYNIYYYVIKSQFSS